jgi:hypothetical protein
MALEACENSLKLGIMEPCHELKINTAMDLDCCCSAGYRGYRVSYDAPSPTLGEACSKLRVAKFAT